MRKLRYIILSVVLAVAAGCQSPSASSGSAQNERSSSYGIAHGKPKLTFLKRVKTDEQPKQICFHPARDEIYVTNLGGNGPKSEGPGSLQIFSLKEGKILHREKATAAVECLVSEEDSNILYYSDMFRDEVVKFDLANRQVIWRGKVKEDKIRNFHGAAYRYMPKIVHPDYDSGILYVSMWLNGVSLLDEKTGALQKRIDRFCSLPRGLLYRDGILHVMCYGIGIKGGVGEIVRINPKTEEIISRQKTGGSPRHIVPYGKDKALISNLNTGQMYLYDVKSGSIERKLQIGASNTIVLDPGNEYVYANDRQRDRILLISLKEWKIAGIIKTGKYPTGLAVSPDGKYLAVTNFHEASYDLFRIDRVSDK